MADEKKPLPELSAEAVKAFHALRNVRFVGYHGTDNMRAAIAIAALFQNAPLSEDGKVLPNVQHIDYNSPHHAIDTFMDCTRDTLQRLERGMSVDIGHLKEVGTRAEARDYVEKLISTLRAEIQSHYPEEFKAVSGRHETQAAANAAWKVAK